MGAAPGTSPTPAPDAVPKARRVPGRRGTATRRRLLEATRDLLAAQPYRATTVVDIARRAGVAPATFYQYFPDVERAVLVLAEEALTDVGAVAAEARGDWDHGPVDRAAGVARALVDFWDRHRPVLTVMDLVVCEGDTRFLRIRTAALHELALAFEDVVRRHQQRGDLGAGVDPVATAAILVGTLAHAAAHHPGLVSWGMAPDVLVDTQARLLAWALTGHGERRDAAP